MEQITKDRLTAIFVCLYYGTVVEIIEIMEKFPGHYTLDYEMFFMQNGQRNRFVLKKEEVDFLRNAGIIELDGGCEEFEFERCVFTCTDYARNRMDNMIREHALVMKT